jgi:hypothetical protein
MRFISVMKVFHAALPRAGAPSLRWLEYINHSNDKQAGSLRPKLLVRADQCEKADARFSCFSLQQVFDYRSIRVFLHNLR